MPNLKKYTKSIGTDTSGSDFKPFVESSKASLILKDNVLGMFTIVWNNMMLH